MEFVLGAAIITNQVPLALGTAALKLTKSLIERRRGCWRKTAARKHAAQNGNVAASLGASEQVLLQWDDLTCTLQTKDGKRTLLSGLSGEAKPGRLLAIMGPSGSGKTTLLNSLAGQVPASAKLELHGSILLNGKPQQQEAAVQQQGYVQQEDLFFSMLTVRETLTLAAELRLDPSTHAEQREQYVCAHMQRLGLSKCADTPVGDAKTRGLSGGEKKRLQIACELVNSPMLVFADEPTTGLDSFQAEKVMQALKDLTKDGHTVVASIHQPRSSIFSMFDDVLLLAEGGRAVYNGPADGMLSHFESLGQPPCPEHTNPAEYASDLISADYSSPEALQQSRQRVEQLVVAYAGGGQRKRSPQMEAHQQPQVEAFKPRRGPLGQLSLLYSRAWRQVTRDKANLVARVMSNFSSAIVFGTVFWRMGRGQSAIQDRMGLLQLSAVATAMTSMIKTLNVFPTERTIVNRERTKQSYQLVPYILGKLGAELPIGSLFPALFGALIYPACGLHPSWLRFGRFLGILVAEAFTAQAMGLAVGALAPSTDAALAIGPAIMTVFIVFGGLYINPDNVVAPLRWLPRASLIKASFEALCVNEFSGLEFDADGSPGALKQGDQVLGRMGFKGSTVRGAVMHQGRLLLFNYWATYCILKSRRPRFQRLLEPPPPPVQQQQGQDKAQAGEGKAQAGKEGPGEQGVVVAAGSCAAANGTTSELAAAANGSAQQNARVAAMV